MTDHIQREAFVQRTPAETNLFSLHRRYAFSTKIMNEGDGMEQSLNVTHTLIPEKRSLLPAAFGIAMTISKSVILQRLQRVKILSSLLVLALFSAPVFAQTQSTFNPKKTHYLWPTSASHALSSTFAETRAGHFHAALDIKTWGRRGYPVYATRSGTLHRIAIGPTGYGKVIYLKHDDGSFSVYAHLLRFNKSIQQWADSIRFQNYTSSIDINVDSLNIDIRQGEKIGISGASGIGPPHLHFELRTPDNEPFNPLQTNLAVKDTQTPLFSSLAIEPLSMESHIEGHNTIYTRHVSRGKEYAHFGTIKVSGPVGLGVSVFDRADGVHNSYAVYTLTMSVDGREVFQSKVDHFSYQNTHQMFLDRIYPLLKNTGRAYQRLYIADGNTLPFYTTKGNAGHLDLSPGRHEILIKASDYFGNTRTAQLKLMVQKPKKKLLIYQNNIQNGTSPLVSPMHWQWFNNWVNIPADQFSKITLTPLLNSFTEQRYYNNGKSISVNLKYSPQFYFRVNAQHYFISRRINPSDAAYLTTPHHQAYASFPAGCFYDTTSIAIIRRKFTPDSIRINLFPENQPIAKSYNLSVKMDSVQLHDSTFSFYQYNPKNEHLYKLSTQRKGHYLAASPSSLGTFMILADSLGPVIHHPRIVKRPDGKWLIYLPIDDNRAGIDYQKTQIYVNSIRGITEYEPEDDRLVYYHPAFKPKSKNLVKIIAYDREGNKTIKEMYVTFRK